MLVLWLVSGWNLTVLTVEATETLAVTRSMALCPRSETEATRETEEVQAYHSE